MTIETQTPRIVYIGSGTRGPFSLQDGSGNPIRVRNATDLVVWRYASTTDEVGDQLVYSTDFTVTNTDPDNATLTLTSAQAVLASTERLVVTREQSISQTLDLVRGGNFGAPADMAQRDIVAEQIQELRLAVDRAIKVDWRETAERALPLPPTSAAAYLYRDTDGSIGQAAAVDLSAADPSWSDLLGENAPFNYPAGAVGDGVKGYSGVATATDQTFTDSNAAFVAADIGKVIVIKNAGAARLKVNSATVSAGGTGHAVGDMLTVSGGTSRSATVFRVDAVTAGVVTAVSVRSRGHYTTLPSNPAATTSSGSGVSCTLTLTSETIYEPHRTTIASINSGTSVELTAAPTTSVASSARYTYGTDDTASLQACLNAAGFMGAMALAAGRVYCFSNLTLPTNAASGNYYKNRNAIVCPDGMAELACIGGGDDDYGIAPDRWLTANPNKAFAGSPWMFRNIIVDGLYTVERTFVHKSYSSFYENSWFRGGLIADVEATRQNQDGTDGTSGYNSGNKFVNCGFDGEGLYQFRSIGDTTGLEDATTDGDLIDCDFNGQAKADWGAYIGNGGGWIVSRSRWYSQRIAGAYIDTVARGGMVSNCNFEGGDETYDTVPGLIIGKMGGYADAVIGPGNKHYSPVVADFKADTSAETIRIKGDHFQTKIDASPDATAIHNNNRSQKILALEDCTGDADPLYSRASGNTAGIIELYRCTSASATGSLKYITQLRDEPGATTSPETYTRETASPAGGDDIYSVEYYSRDSAGNRTQYGGMRFEIGAPTDAAEFGRYIWTTIANGTFADRFTMQSGLYATSLTDPGDGDFNAKTGYYANNLKVVGTRKTGWTVPTGTRSRATFDVATVTLAELAARVAALEDDLHATAGHGLIGA